eukprot:GFYU01003936.1.p1 GENE.GFYU01003936.1~~GFYU01003936.1.p1  ORF type:complete len:629 (+),score=113.16 GFYU01003936.1:164-2050(+)
MPPHNFTQSTSSPREGPGIGHQNEKDVFKPVIASLSETLTHLSLLQVTHPQFAQEITRLQMDLCKCQVRVFALAAPSPPSPLPIHDAPRSREATPIVSPALLGGGGGVTVARTPHPSHPSSTGDFGDNENATHAVAGSSRQHARVLVHTQMKLEQPDTMDVDDTTAGLGDRGNVYLHHADEAMVNESVTQRTTPANATPTNTTPVCALEVSRDHAYGGHNDDNDNNNVVVAGDGVGVGGGDVDTSVPGSPVYHSTRKRRSPTETPESVGAENAATVDHSHSRKRLRSSRDRQERLAAASTFTGTGQGPSHMRGSTRTPAPTTAHCATQPTGFKFEGPPDAPESLRPLSSEVRSSMISAAIDTGLAFKHSTTANITHPELVANATGILEGVLAALRKCRSLSTHFDNIRDCIAVDGDKIVITWYVTNPFQDNGRKKVLYSPGTADLRTSDGKPMAWGTFKRIVFAVTTLVAGLCKSWSEGLQLSPTLSALGGDAILAIIGLYQPAAGLWYVNDECKLATGRKGETPSPLDVLAPLETDEMRKAVETIYNGNEQTFKAGFCLRNGCNVPPQWYCNYCGDMNADLDKYVPHECKSVPKTFMEDYSLTLPYLYRVRRVPSPELVDFATIFGE